MHDLDRVLSGGIERADADRPNGEVLQNFHDRRSAYVLIAFEEATGITQDDLENRLPRGRSIAEVIAGAIDLADADRMPAERLGERRGSYILEAIAKATGIPAYDMRKLAERETA